MNGMSVKNFCNETLSKTNFPLGRIKVHLILSYCHKSWMFDKMKKSLLKFPKKMKDVNNGDTVPEYRAFEELHQFIEESVIGGLYLFKIKELHSLYV